MVVDWWSVRTDFVQEAPERTRSGDSPAEQHKDGKCKESRLSRSPPPSEHGHRQDAWAMGLGRRKGMEMRSSLG